MTEGRALISVCFTLDYIQFVFGDFVLAALADPIVCEGDATITTNTPGYRDVLCRLIGTSVLSTDETESCLEIELDNGARILIPLDAAWPPGPEMATLSGNGKFHAAWTRPGLMK